MSHQTTKPVQRVVERIGLMTNVDKQTLAIIQHMIESLVASRDKVIAYQKTKLKDRTAVIETTRITGALRDTINAHGPITKELISSASKRICGQLSQVVDEPCNSTGRITI